MSELKTVNLFLVGPGKVGTALLQQIEKNRGFFEEKLNLQIRLRGVITRTKMYSSPGVSPSGQLTGRAMPAEVDIFLALVVHALEVMLGDIRLLVDCTAGEVIVPYYATLLSRGISVVTANKCANSGSLDQYREIREAAKRGRTRFLYEANVGGGLPVVSTLQRLQAVGDRVTKVRGAFSGTLNYILSRLETGRKFSEVVAEAQANGYTEPDPRQDLSGQDVARKILILAREIGISLEMADVFVESMNKDDEVLEEKRRRAKSGCRVLRYVSVIDSTKSGFERSHSKLREVNPDDPCAQLKGVENCFEIYSQNYDKSPLIIKGPGAGVEVTAASVLADILKVARNV